MAEPDAGGLRGEGREARERLERDLVRGDGLRLDVVEEPQGVEAQPLRLVRDRHCARPGACRRPAVVLAGPALRNDDPDAHGR